jgi:hypothetical protein
MGIYAAAFAPSWMLNTSPVICAVAAPLILVSCSQKTIAHSYILVLPTSIFLLPVYIISALFG